MMDMVERLHHQITVMREHIVWVHRVVAGILSMLIVLRAVAIKQYSVHLVIGTGRVNCTRKHDSVYYTL